MGQVALIVPVIKGNSIFFREQDLLTEFVKEGNALYVIIDPTAESIVVPDGTHLTQAGDKSISACCNTIAQEVSDLGYDFLFFYDENTILSLDALREMSVVLESADRHGVVSPRMHRAPFFALPVAHPELGIGDALDACIDEARKTLPSYSVVPFASITCFATKAHLAINYGFFDISLEFGEACIRDYCMRINQYGYSSVLANHIYVRGDYHFDAEILPNDASTIDNRYPYHREVLEKYLSTKMDAADRFLDLAVAECHKKTRLLLEFSIMPAVHNGTSEFQLSLLEHLSKLYGDKYELFARVNPDAMSYHRLANRFPTVCFDGDFKDTFHLGLSATQPSSLEQIAFMNAHCRKIIFALLDIIMCRTDYLRSEDLDNRDATFDLGAAVSDGLIAISEYSKNDYLAYYPNSSGVKKPSIEVIHIATDVSSEIRTECSKIELPFEKFYLIAGNKYKHKALRETAQGLKESKRNYVVIGLRPDECPASNFLGLEGGVLDDEVVDYLYSNCKAVIFPSVYEGYGLPIAIAMKKGKFAIVHNNPLNKELLDSMPEIEGKLFFYDYFSQIDDIVEHLECCDIGESPHLGTWQDVVVEIESYLSRVLAQNNSAEVLNYRNFLVELTSLGKIKPAENEKDLKQLLAERFLEGHPFRYRIARTVYKIFRKS